MFLIEHHLDLSAIMNSRDLSDPATAANSQTMSKPREAPLPYVADLRRYQRREPGRDDALAARTVVAHVPRRVSRADARSRYGADPSHGKRRQVGVAGGLPYTLPAHAYFALRSRAHMAAGESEPEQGVALAIEHQRELASHCCCRRPARFAGRARRNGLFVWHEHRSRRSVRKCQRIVLDHWCLKIPCGRSS